MPPRFSLSLIGGMVEGGRALGGQAFAEREGGLKEAPLSGLLYVYDADEVESVGGQTMTSSSGPGKWRGADGHSESERPSQDAKRRGYKVHE